MPDASKGFQMMIRHTYFQFVVLFFLAACWRSGAQELSNSCFAVHLIKDGKTIESPRSVTFLDQDGKQNVDIREGTFCVPASMKGQPALDLSFVLGEQRFYFPRLPEARFQASWDISFGGRKYALLAGLPKGTKASTACSVIFRQGEPEIGMIFSPCRVSGKTPLK
jgi:hypothetical protein